MTYTLRVPIEKEDLDVPIVDHDGPYLVLNLDALDEESLGRVYKNLQKHYNDE